MSPSPEKRRHARITPSPKQKRLTRRPRTQSRAAGVASIDVAKSPIHNPEREKTAIEQGGEIGYFSFLCKKLGTRRLVVYPESLGKRISEVYRLCYESGRDVAIVQDFATTHPELVFQAPWLAALVRSEAVAWRFGAAWGNKGKLNTLLRALANGFRLAAERAMRLPRDTKPARLQAARLLREAMQGDIREFITNVVDPRGMRAQRNAETDEQLEPLISEKVAELIQQSPLLAEVASKLQNLIRDGHAYKAAVLIASRVLKVSPRALERRPITEVLSS